MQFLGQLSLISQFSAACVSESTTTGVQLVFTVRRMFELFLDVIPIVHAKLLDELPLAAALHHNNTMFIAHHITTFGILFKGRLPEDLMVLLPPSIDSMNLSIWIEPMT